MAWFKSLSWVDTQGPFRYTANACAPTVNPRWEPFCPRSLATSALANSCGNTFHRYTNARSVSVHHRCHSDCLCWKFVNCKVAVPVALATRNKSVSVSAVDKRHSSIQLCTVPGASHWMVYRGAVLLNRSSRPPSKSRE